MSFEVFSLPAHGKSNQSADLNQFLSGKKVLGIERSLVQGNGEAYWTFCVEYIDGEKQTAIKNPRMRKKIDYKSVLSPEVFEGFSIMRAKRKEIAEAESIPAYAVFTDAELVGLASMENVSLAAMQKIDGIGEAKVKKYGSVFLELLKEKKEAKS